MRGYGNIGVFATTLLLAGCGQRMMDQPRLKPYAESDFFADGSSMRPLPPGVVPVGGLQSQLFRTGVGADGYLAGSIQVPVDRAVLERGRERFQINCAVCHGFTGDGDGMVVQRGFPNPPSFHSDRLRNAPAGHFVNVMAYGYGAMYSYASRVAPRDRWAITAYIRALQLSRNGKVGDVPAASRNQVEEGK
jgi:mono/diheme cytochrome c family protein